EISGKAAGPRAVSDVNGEPESNAGLYRVGVDAGGVWGRVGVSRLSDEPRRRLDEPHAGSVDRQPDRGACGVWARSRIPGNYWSAGSRTAGTLAGDDLPADGAQPGGADRRSWSLRYDRCDVDLSRKISGLVARRSY